MQGRRLRYRPSAWRRFNDVMNERAMIGFRAVYAPKDKKAGSLPGAAFDLGVFIVFLVGLAGYLWAR